MSELPPAWYTIRGDSYPVRWLNLMHWPYTLFHLSFVVIGAAVAPDLSLTLLGWTGLAFFLGMGISAHAYDLLRGDPLRLGLPRLHLHLAGVLALAGACGIGAWQVVIGNVSPGLSIFIPLGVLFAVGYGLECPGLHGDWQFPTWWAVFPLLVAYFVQGITWTWVLIPVVAFTFLAAHTQRVLSTRVRFIRRKMGHLEADGGISKEWLLDPDEKALAYLSFAMVTLAAGLLVLRLV